MFTRVWRGSPGYASDTLHDGREAIQWDVEQVNDFGLQIKQVRAWFPREQDTPYVLVRVRDDDAQAFDKALALPVRRCYIADSLLSEKAAQHGVSQRDLIAAKLPDPGSTMAGDFGEILVYLFQGTEVHASTPIGATKWRLKQDRTKSAPYSDVIHFVLPFWPNPSADDAVLCAEVKTKSTHGKSKPVEEAIADSLKDCTGRLARTLVWLRERALTGDVDDIRIDHLDRFIKATDHPPAERRFRAVAVLSADLETTELCNVDLEPNSDCALVVIIVPNLHAVYTAVYKEARTAVVS